jgi:membrane dipeptidase
MTPIIDSHLDLSWNALGWNRDLRLSVEEIRRSEAGMPGGKGRGNNTVCFPELRHGGIGISIATLLARRNPRGTYTNLDFRTQEIACAVARGQLAYYRQLEDDGVCRVITDWPAFEASLNAWKTNPDTEPLGFVISMEGADPILAPKDAERWYSDGLRAVGLAHYGPSAYAHGTGCEGGLTAAGRDILLAIQDLGMILDLTHLADESFYEAADLFRGTVLASHNNCRALTPGGRQFTDDQIRLIVERDGVIGAALDNWMLIPDWSPGAHVTLEDVVNHMDHICQLAGNARHIAIGSDLDGGFGTEQSPNDLNTIADLRKLEPILQARGYSAPDIENVFYGNWARLFQTAWQRQ